MHCETFQELGVSWNISDELFKQLLSYVCTFYCAKNGTMDVNLMRYQMFLAKKGDVESFCLPPCKDCLYKKCFCANYEAGRWRRSLTACPNIPNSVGHGWLMEESDSVKKLVFDWMDGQPAPIAVMELFSDML